MPYDSDFEPILRQNLIRVTHAMMLHTLELPSAFSKRVFNDASFLKRWRDGETGFGVRLYDDAMKHLSHVFPEDCEWPAGVPRPAPQERSYTPRSRKGEA